MGKDLNAVSLTGRLGADPEMRYTPGGKAVVSLRVAVSGYNDATDWITVTAWDKTAETSNQYLTKGSRIAVNGRLQTRSWEDKESGAKRSATEVVATDIVFLDSKGERGEAFASTRSTGRNQPQPVDDDDDIPF